MTSAGMPRKRPSVSATVRPGPGSYADAASSARVTASPYRSSGGGDRAGERADPVRPGHVLEEDRPPVGVGERQPPVRVLPARSGLVLRAQVADRISECDADE